MRGRAIEPADLREGRHLLKVGRAAISAVSALALVLVASGSAVADDGTPDAIEALEVVPQLMDTAPSSPTVPTESSLGFVAQGTAGAPTTTTIERLNAASTSVTYDEGGQTVIEGTSVDTDTVVQQLSDGGRVLEVISSPAAPQEFDYAIDVPDGMEIMPQEDGSILIGTQSQVGDQVIVEVDGVIGAAWAVDATGVDVPARYDVSDAGVITMHVDHSDDVTYPVVADPTYTGGGFRVTWTLSAPHLVFVHLNKARSADAADVGAGVCVGVAFVPVVGAAIVAVCGVHNILIRAAARYGYCQHWQVNLITRSFSAGSYRGGFCT